MYLNVFIFTRGEQCSYEKLYIYMILYNDRGLLLLMLKRTQQYFGAEDSTRADVSMNETTRAERKP